MKLISNDLRDGAAPPKGETHRYILPFTRWM